MGYNSQFVEIWEGRPFVHIWQGCVQRDRRVNSGSNKQSDNSPGGGAFSPHVRMVPCILHLWVMLLYLTMTLGLVANGRSAATLLMEIPAGLLYLCIPIVFFYFTAKLAFEEIPQKLPKRRRNSLYRHPMNCICPLCTMNLRCAQSSKHSRGGVKYTAFLFPPRQQTPDQRDALMVIENWNSLEVNRLLLVLAGDVEVNPGPITLHDLTKELEKLTKPLSFGNSLKIPWKVLGSIARNQRKDDVDGQKRALFEYIASNYEKHEITWAKIADALEVIARDLAVDIRQKYCDLTLKKPTGGAAKSVQVEGVYHSKKTTAEVRAEVRAGLEVGCDAACGTDIHFLAESEDKVLTIATHLQPVKSSIWKARSLWKEIGRALGISDDIICTIHCAKDGECLNEVLSRWIHSGKATISDLLLALANKTVDRNDIKNEIHVLKGVLESTVGHAHHESQLPSVSESNDETETTSTQSPSEDTDCSSSLQKLRFTCGCGKCSLLDYVSGTQCPNPKQLPFPKLGLSGVLSDFMTDIDIFEQSLFEQSKQMHIMFVRLLQDTVHGLEEKLIDLAKVKNYLRLLFRPQWYFPKVYSKDITGTLEAADNLQELCCYLQCNYCSWFNYDLVKSLREVFLFQRTKDQLLADYEDTYEQYVYRRCFLYLDDVGPSPSNQVEVVCKVDVEFGTISYDLIKHLKLKFTKIIGVSKYHLTFKQVRTGCTELCFRAPKYIQNLKCLSNYQKRKLREHDFLEIKIANQCLFRDDSKLEDTGSVSEASEMDDSSGVEGDMDTTDIELPGVHLLEHQIPQSCKCEEDLVLLKELDIDVSPCSLWEAHHNGQPCMALVYNSQTRDDSRGIFDYAEKTLVERPNIIKAKCIHHDEKLSTHPIIVLEYEESLLDYCSRSSTPALSDVDQLSVLCDIALGVISFQSSCSSKLIVTKASIFLHEDNAGKIKAKLCPVYGHSYLPQQESAFDSSTDLQWLKNITALINNGKDGQAELPKNHILFNILQYKWLSEEQDKRPQRIEDVAKELEYLLDLETTRIGMIATLDRSDLLDVAHLHMLLIGHTGVGKTSIRKHLQDTPMDHNEKSTVIMEPELLCQETIEASTDKSESSFVFLRNDNVYKSEPDKVFLTLWDTGGQQMFQDLLSCFAKVRSIYGIVFRLPDLLSTERATVRPSGSVECQGESPYTDSEYIYRSLAFLNSFSFDMHQRFSSLPAEVLGVFDSTELHSFPKVALIGTCKDKLSSDAKQDLKQKYHELKIGLQDFNLLDRTLLPAGEDDPVLFEIDNTKSGTKRGDPEIGNLRHQIISCTQKVMAKIPSEWMSFKIELERESRLQCPCTGIVTLEKANEIASQHSIDSRVALTYFHELGIFLWYHYNQNLREYVIVEPKQLLNVLGTILDPAKYSNFPEEWKKLQSGGVLSLNLRDSLLNSHTSGLPLSWVLDFLDVHYLAMPLKEGYFVPSMLQITPICPNRLHVQDITAGTCSNILQNADACPLFIVPKSNYIPPGLFPRLMTVLAGISDGPVEWRISPSATDCRNMVAFHVNDHVGVVFTEFIDCIRVHCSLPNKTVSQELCTEIVSILKVQLQRVLPQPHKQPVTITFACFCSKNSDFHFLPDLPLATDNELSCSTYPQNTMKLTPAHTIWLKEKPTSGITSKEDAKTHFQAAMKNGSFSLRITNLLFTGLPGSGVTTTSCKNMILDSSNTPLAEPPHSLLLNPTHFEHSYYTIDSYDNKELKLLRFEDLRAFFANCATSLSTRQSRDINTGTDESQEHGTSRDTISSQSNKKPGRSSDHPHGRDTASGDQTDQSKDTQSSRVKREVESHIHEIEELDLDSLKTSADSENILDLMLKSSGEQHQLELVHGIKCTDLELLEVLPIFLRGISLCVVCVDVSHNLDEQGLIEAQTVAEQISPLTSKQLIHQFLPLTQKLLVTGSHAKQTLGSQETRQANNRILSSLSKDKLILDGKEAIFSVNAHSVGDQNAARIQERIISLTELSEQKQVPFSWHLLGHKLKEYLMENDRKIVSKNYFSEYAREFHVSEDDLDAALQHLHELGLLFHYGDIIPNAIFIDLTVFTDIIVSIKINSQHSSPSAHSAVITVYDFQQVRNVYVKDLFTYKEAIKLFQELNIISKLGDNSTFIMPCLIKEVLSSDNFMKHCKDDTSVAPLLIQCPMAHGLFSFVVNFLTSKQNKNPWPWAIAANADKNKPVCLYKNSAQFTLPGYNTLITLLVSESEELLQVHVEFKHERPSLVPIRNALSEGLNRAYTALHCPGSLDYKVTVSQQIWFEEFDYDKDPDSLSIHRAFSKLLHLSDTWFHIGLHLGLDGVTLQAISVSYRHNADSALMEVIKYWFYNTHNPEWADLKSLLSETKGSTHEQFICPFCHECSVEQFFSKKGCPKAEQKTFFPYLDMDNLDEADKIDLQQRLISDTRKMVTKFAYFTSFLEKSLEDQKIPLKQIAECVLSLQAFTEDIGLKLLKKKDEEAIQQAQSVTAIFIILRPYISFFNYEIMEHLVEHHGSPDDHKRLKEFLTAFNTFCQRSVFEVPPNVYSSKSRTDCKVFVVKCTERVATTLESVRGVRGKIADILGLKASSLQLRSIAKGCVELRFLVSTAVVNRILPVPSAKKLALKEIGVRVLEQDTQLGENTAHQLRFSQGSTHSSELHSLTSQLQEQHLPSQEGKTPPPSSSSLEGISQLPSSSSLEGISQLPSSSLREGQPPPSSSSSQEGQPPPSSSSSQEGQLPPSSSSSQEGQPPPPSSSSLEGKPNHPHRPLWRESSHHPHHPH